MTRKHRAPWVAAAAVPLFLLAGCSGVVPDFTAPAGPPSDGTAQTGEERVDPAGGKAVPQDLPTSTRQVARTGSMTIAVTDVVKAARQVRDLAEANGGIVTSENVVTRQADSESTSRITVSVPSAKLNDIMDEAAAFGELRSRTVTAKDVTTQVVDVEARIRTLRDSIDRIRKLMARTGSIGDIAEVERELTARQAELESMLAQQKALKDQVEQAPITVTLIAPGQVVLPDNPLLAGLKQGWDALLRSLAALLVLIGTVFPFAVLAAAVAVPLVWWRRRNRARKPSATVAAPAPHVSEATPTEAQREQEPPAGTTAS